MANTSSWSYADNGYGPRSWQDRYKVEGKLQSPIDIDTEKVKDDNIVEPINFQYVNIDNSTITNDGRHLQVTLTRNESVVTGGPLTDKYQLAVIRFHWGHDDSSGSEHSINEQNYPLEVQLIHWNKGLYKHIGEAMAGENGLCIIGLLLQVSDDDNECLTPIVKLLSRDENKGCFSLEVKSTIDPNHFIRDMTAYWTYQGSLTTPPLSENVTWIISQNVMDVSEKQMNAFRSVRNSSGEPMTDHCRPTCPLNERSIRSCIVENISDLENHQDNNINIVEDDDVDKENELRSEDANYHGNDDEENDDEENELPGENVNYHGNDDEENELPGENANYHGNDDEENELPGENANYHGNDDEENELPGENANYHGNDDKENELPDENYHGNDDKENELPDENANYHDNDAESDATEKGYFDEIYALEGMNNLVD
ncbi:nickel cation binding [Desmophyllum pertusum]|uniref:carbonic anhydrase n=1 Tax=Desmophyllum pertusum TaxID=174260 RepID=A0A9W9YXP9_9CNID|nr:nickel cation binding [Desmophyllum pertusum]